MNTRKKNKRHKAPKKGIKTKTKDGQAEVFVLPPDLLQKLGIDLGSVGSSIECPTYTTNKADDHLNDAPVDSNNGKQSENITCNTQGMETKRDSTILETADLMKKSVFLSPTFVTADSIDPGELEISNVMELRETKEAITQNYTDTMPTEVAVGPFSQIDNENATVISNKQSSVNPDKDKIVTHTNTTNAESKQVIAESLPRMEKLSVIVNHEGNTTEINYKSSISNPDSDKEISNPPDNNLISLSTHDNSEMTVNSNTIENISDKCEIEKPFHRDTKTILTQVAEDEHFPQIDNIMSVIMNTKNTTEICNEKSTLNPDSDIEISNSSDSNYILLPAQDVFQTKVGKDVRAKSTDDHSDEAYMSDCSNRTLSPTDNTDSVLNIPEINSYVSTECQNKVKIISEEILSPSKFKNLQIMLSPKNSRFIPVPMNCILEKHKLREKDKNITNTIDKLTNTCVSPVLNSSVIPKEDQNKDLDLLELYDEKGNNISVLKNSSNFDIVTDVKIEDLSQSTEQDSASEMHTPENHTFGDIDLVVIGMDIEENEDILENFVHEITSNDDNNILKKIEQSEKYCSPVKLDSESIVPKKLTCTLSENKLVEIEDQRNINLMNTDELVNFAVDSNITENSSNDLNQSMTNDKELQVLEMVTNCNNNVMQSDLGIKNIELGGINKKLDFETDLIKSKTVNTHTINKATETSSNDDMIDTDLEYIELNVIPFTSNVIEERNENVDDTRNNEFLSISHSDAKSKEKKDEYNLKPNENTMICTVNEHSTIIERKSEEIDTNNSPEELPKNLNKVQEIAMYLSQFAKNHSDTGKARRKSITKMKIPAKRSKHNALTSKIYIQGVEKPGGSQRSDEESDDFKVHKVKITYARPKRTQKRITRPLVVTPTKESQNINVSIYEQEDSNNLIQESHKNTEFCLCGDFGRLANYDSDIPYEHIHFWEHKLGLCDRESVFSIYDDADKSDVNIDSKITEISDFLEGQDKSSKTLLDSICWHSCKKVDIPSQNDETKRSVSVTKDTTNTKEVTVLTDLSSNTDNTIKPTKVCYIDKSTSKAVCELQSENNSVAINKKSECLIIDFNTSKEMSSPHDEKKNYLALPVKDVQCSRETASRKENPKVRDANNDAKGDVKDAKTFKSELKKKIANKIKSAKSFDCMKNDKADDNETIKKSDLLKNDSINVEKQIVANEFPKHLKDRLMFEGGTTDESSQIKTNVSTSVDNVKSVDKHIVDVEVDEVDHNTPKTENTQEKKKGKKRRKSEKRNENDNEEPASKKSVKCDVCKQVLSEEQWENHVASEHCYIAWKSGSTFNFENLRLLKQLQDRIKTNLNLKCTFCSTELAHPKKFIKHVQMCISKLEDSSSVSMETPTETVHDISQSNTNLQEEATVNAPERSKSVSSADTWVCGVCNETVTTVHWMEHIRQKHDYLAWKVGDVPLNLDSEDDVRIHLLNISRVIGELTCSNCGLARRYPKSYMQHIQQCTGKDESKLDRTVGDQQQMSDDDTGEKTLHGNRNENKSVASDEMWECGVCKEIVSENAWLSHIKRKHEYLAWKVGDHPLNLDNEEEVRIHLLNISRVSGGLICSKCGLSRKYPKSYMQHIQQCTGNDESRANQTGDVVKSVDYIVHELLSINKTESPECAICKETVAAADWIEHIKRKHDYLAWKTGHPPLNLDNEEEIRVHLFEIVKVTGELTCSKCGLSRKYPKSFMQHIQQCTGKDESLNTSTGTVEIEYVPRNPTDPVKCAVCSKDMLESQWMQHILDEHHYIAWREGEKPLNLDNEEEIRVHLFEIVRVTGELTCSKCGLSRKYPKSFMQHIQQCTGKDESLNTSTGTVEIEYVPRNPTDPVKCAVCSKDMLESQWMQHILDEHQYIAWREGEQPLNVNDAEAMKTYLYNISKETGCLTCNKCGRSRKYVKVYLQHIESCTGQTTESEVLNESVGVASVKAETNYLAIVDQDTTVTCAVCHKEVSSAKWIQHIGRAHNYMAHYKGQSLDLNDQEVVYSYLYEVVKRVGHLVCSKCGLMRKYAKTFIQHTSTCNVEATTNYDSNGETQTADGKLVCAVCSKEMEPKKWNQHKMEHHYNVAWTVGSIPVDVKNAYVIDMLLKDYVDKYKKMACNACGATRASRLGFYAHVIQCGKTEAEIDAQKTTCGVCKKKYLYIYHNQHMAWHTQQEANAQRKLKQAEEEEQKRLLVKQEQEAAVVEDATPGRRRAAQKAKNVIENLKNDNFTYNCPNCKFGGDSKEEMLNHVCKGIEAKDDQFSDSGESARVGEYSGGEESEDSIEVDSDVSKEETENVPKRKRKKKYPTYINTRRYPFVPKNLNLFLKKAGTEFLQQHFVNDILFPNLRSFDCEPIPSDELSKYLPPLEESCKVQLGTKEWVTYRRFQVDRKECVNAKLNTVSLQCMFTGGYIQCVSWSRPEPGKEFSLNFLAVACHQGSDVIRLQVDETPAHPGLIQLWSFGDFTQEAELSLGMAHEYGSAWAMDWCPYGARDAFPQEGVNVLRLGLLAVAFSSGTVAVFAVPYPASLVKKEKLFQKLKPVVELRQTMNPERQIFQATSVCWSKQKPYDSIVVGYADGTTAYFDLNTESPFLKAVENGVIVLYPYHDERTLNKCVTALDLYPSVDSVGPAGAACFSSGSGVSLLTRPGVRPARQFISAAMASAHFEPLWPSAALVGDEGNLASAVNEIEWYGGGRRMGGGCAGAGCERCGRFVFAALPLLCIRYPHPADNCAKTQVAGVLQMTPLAKKRKKLANDELQTIVEPTTYENAVTKYGIKIGIDKETLKKATELPHDSYPERFPERFPLGDVTSMAFCPDIPHHKKLAVATHSGMLFLIEV